MPLKLKKKPKAQPDQPKSAALSLDEARAKYEFGTIERAVAECRAFVDIKNEARELGNASNRAKTQAGKALGALITNETIARGDRIIIEDIAFSYDYATADTVPSEEFLKLYEAKQISRETYLKCVNVSKDMATKLVGAHVLEDVMKTKIGNKADVRVTALDKAIDIPFKIDRKPPPAPKVKKTQNEPVAITTGSTRKPNLRKIKAMR